MYDVIGGRATWTALGLPTEGSVGDRRRISHYLEQANTVGVSATVGDTSGEGPIAVIDSSGVLVGSLADSSGGLPATTPVARAMVPAPGTIRPELRVDEVATRLRDDTLDHVFVTTVSGVLLGIVFADRLHA